MDKLQEFFNELKDRANNPFIGSFIISFLLWNWKLPVSWIFYNNDALFKYHFTNHIDLICNTVTIYSGLFNPILSAFGYTFVWPVIRSGIKAFHTKVSTVSENYNLKISKAVIVPIDKFISLRAALENKEALLAKVLGNESATIAEISELKINLNNAITSSNEAMEKLKTSAEFNNVNILNGNWVYYESEEDIRLKNGQLISFGDGRCFHRRRIANAATGPDEIGEVINFLSNDQTLTLSFFFISKNQRVFKSNTAQFLIMSVDRRKMNGKDNLGNDLYYLKE